MKKILIVDDEPEIRKLVGTTLLFDNFIILQAKNGQEAVEIATLEKPDIIIMDVSMPIMNGIKATELIKNNPLTKDCVIVMLTAQEQEADRDKGYKAGADDYFIKPFSPLELIQKVDSILSKS